MKFDAQANFGSRSSRKNGKIVSESVIIIATA
jgi:hypothetical protein